MDLSHDKCHIKAFILPHNVFKLTNPNSKSKLHFGVSLETHFQTTSTLDKVHLEHPVGNKSYLSMLCELTKGPLTNLNPNKKTQLGLSMTIQAST